MKWWTGASASRTRRREFEKRFIERVLADGDGNLSETATKLGIHRNTLARKMAELRIKRPR